MIITRNDKLTERMYENLHFSQNSTHMKFQLSKLFWSSWKFPRKSVVWFLSWLTLVSIMIGSIIMGKQSYFQLKLFGWIFCLICTSIKFVLEYLVPISLIFWFSHFFYLSVDFNFVDILSFSWRLSQYLDCFVLFDPYTAPISIQDLFAL